MVVGLLGSSNESETVERILDFPENI